MRELLYFINSPFMFTLKVMILQLRRHHLPRRWLPNMALWIHICEYNYDLYFAYIIWENRGWLCMQKINLHRPFFIVNIKNGWGKFRNIGRKRQSATMRGQMRGPIQIARMNMTMGSGQWTPMLWCTKNKVGVIISLGVSGMLMYGALEVL